jgi:hypothetical protein
LKFKPIYRYFSEEHFDFSDEAAMEAYLWETRGIGNMKINLFDNKINGYVVGKHWMDVVVKMWREDIKRKLLFKHELYNDPELKDFAWWLDRVLK